MATTIPDVLKSADITRFASRAAQIEKVKPEIAYWCYYWIVQQIVPKGLHNADEDAMTYTMQLMEKLETVKATNSDAIKDEVAARALIKQFGLDVFSRADNAVRANKASRQTADTFQASSTFLELLQIWPPLDTEIVAKIKYAKHHALRIARAIKSGEDPNLSNPVLDPEPEDEVTMLDPNDPEVRAIQGDLSTHHASVEVLPYGNNHDQSHLAARSAWSQFEQPSRDNSMGRPTGTPSPSHHAENYYQTSKDVSPIGPPSNIAPSSIGGGYFPRASDELHTDPSSDAVTLPSAPADVPSSLSNMSPKLPPSVPTYHPGPGQGYPTPSAAFPPPQVRTTAPPHQNIPQSHNQPQTYTTAPPAVVDDQAIIQAQKHARWAISALNFEDIPTAVSELREALELLGARGPW